MDHHRALRQRLVLAERGEAEEAIVLPVAEECDVGAHEVELLVVGLGRRLVAGHRREVLLVDLDELDVAQRQCGVAAVVHAHERVLAEALPGPQSL